MKTTDKFTEVIEEHLKFRAFTDPLFAETLKKPNKNIDDCITYILNTVKSSGSNGFTDDEIFNMAVHYYDEDDIKVGAKMSRSNVVVNHNKLTTQEIADAKQKAIDTVIREQKEKMLKKPVKTTSKPVAEAKKDPTAPATLF